MTNTDTWNERSGMDVTYISGEGRVVTLSLPLESDGSYFFPEKKKDGFIEHFSMEMKDGKWLLRAVSPVYFANGENKTSAVFLQDNQLLSARMGKKQAFLYTQIKHNRDAVLHNYAVANPSVITIGRTEKNGIQYHCSYVSSNHAILQYQAGVWRLTDNGSRNGTFVNGRCVREKQLHLGDVIYIYGLKIIIGTGFLAINDMDERTGIHTGQLTPITRELVDQKLGSTGVHKNDEEEEGFFNRSPRRRLPLEAKEINIESPPMPLNSNEIPLLLRMGGRMGGLAGGLLTGNILYSLTSLIFPFLTQGYTEKQKKEYEEKRVKKYIEYLKTKEQEIQKEGSREQEILNRNYPEFSTVLRYSEETVHLWERRTRDDDFLMIRLGTGKLPLISEIRYPEARFELEADPLEEKMHALAERNYYLREAPVLTSFTEDFVSGVTGSRLNVLNFFYHVVMQIVLLHSYDEVKTVFLLSGEDLKQMRFIRYLPHAWNDQKTIRFIATTESEAFQVGEYLKSQIEEDLTGDQDLTKILRRRPYYMIFAMDQKLFSGMEILKGVMAQEKSPGVSILTTFSQLPKDCSLVFDLPEGREHRVIHLKEIEKEDQVFTLDPYDPEYAGSSIKRLSNIRLKLASEESTLPKILTFLEMFRAGRIEHLNPLKRWKENDPISSLAAPVGVNPDGSTFFLDLHEKYQGPHGLVAGMTGSGKSEFIITYILSMAVNYHPDEVAFILIDYKGGGLAGAFENPETGIRLPHLAGTITNLDGPAIARSLMSIESELRRRQRIFNETKSAVNEGTMDIYAYQKLYRSGIVSEPLPHLFIISDEFAELKQQEPEFMDKLISTARIGRSLGVHLILATQKPAGVVNDQILSNTKFRVCLKVQDRADSMDMLKRPEAAELKETGRFYLQVGYNEYFALGQSAWCGAEYEPADQMEKAKDEEIVFVDHIGNAIHSAKPQKKKISSGKKQLVAIVQMLSALAVKNQIKTRRLWLEALPTEIELSQIVLSKKPACLYACIGMVDDPGNQSQYPLWLDFDAIRHLIVAGLGGSGKSEFLKTMLMSLAQTYGPEDVNFYLLDFSGGGLMPFQELPHCGVYLNDEYPDRITALQKTLLEIRQERKALFAKAMVNGFHAYRKQTQMAHIFVVIDNIAGFLGMKNGDAYASFLEEELREFAAAGIHFIVTCNRVGDMYSRISREFISRIALYHSDRYDYGETLNCNCKYEPPQKPGRGMCLQDGVPLEYQTALVGLGDGKTRREYLIKKLKEAAALWTGQKRAKQVPVIKEDETYAEFAAQFESGRIPLGYQLAEVRPVLLPRKQWKTLSLYFGNPVGVRPVLDNFILAAQREKMQILFFRKQKDSCFTENPHVEDPQKKGAGLQMFDCSEEDLKAVISYLLGEIAVRKKIRNDFCETEGIDPADPGNAKNRLFSYMLEHVQPILLLFESFSDLCAAADKSAKKILNGMFQVAQGYQIYLIGCFYPKDADQLNGDALLQEWNPEKLTMMFGGQLDKQGLVSLPAAYRNLKDPSPAYHKCLMHYRGELHQLQMPCGKLQEASRDEEDSIFSV